MSSLQCQWGGADPAVGTRPHLWGYGQRPAPQKELLFTAQLRVPLTILKHENHLEGGGLCYC